VAVGGFTREELEAIHERATQNALEEEDSSIRTALQVLGEAAANLAVKLPAEEGGREPSSGWDDER
jgi:glucokinase